MVLSRGGRDLGVAFQTHPGSQASSRGEAKDSAFLSSYDRDFRLPLVLAQGSPIFNSSCEGELGIAHESLYGKRDLILACVQDLLFLSRGYRDLGVAFQTHPGSQASSRGEAKDSTLLSSRNGYLLEPTEWPTGSQASCGFWR